MNTHLQSTDEAEHDHDLGLAADLPMLWRRRRLLQLLGGSTLVAIAGCATKAVEASASTTPVATQSGSGSVGSCAPIPAETAGPYPGDGSNGPNALAESGVVRRDITSSFGASSTVAEGVPMTINMRLTDTAAACEPLTSAAVYLWHCDREGRYSMYSERVTGENYLRGVQTSDAAGRLTFVSIFPAAYSGRWPHIHFEVYASLDDATGGGEPVVTSQIALPEDICRTVFSTDGYQKSVVNISGSSLANDNVFGDDMGVSQLATVSGDLETGVAIDLTVAV